MKQPRILLLAPVALLLAACSTSPSGESSTPGTAPGSVTAATLVGRWREAAQRFQSPDTAFTVPATTPGGAATFMYINPDSTYRVATECHPTPGCPGATNAPAVRGIWRLHNGTHLDLRPANVPFEIPPRQLALRGDSLFLTETTPTAQNVLTTQVFVRAGTAGGQ